MVASQACGTSSRVLPLKASRRAPSGRIDRVEDMLQRDFDRARIVQKSNEECSVGRVDIVNGAQPLKIVALLEPDVCTRRFARVDGQTLELVTLGKGSTLREEACIALS